MFYGPGEKFLQSLFPGRLFQVQQECFAVGTFWCKMSNFPWQRVKSITLETLQSSRFLRRPTPPRLDLSCIFRMMPAREWVRRDVYVSHVARGAELAISRAFQETLSRRWRKTTPRAESAILRIRIHLRLSTDVCLIWRNLTACPDTYAFRIWCVSLSRLSDQIGTAWLKCSIRHPTSKHKLNTQVWGNIRGNQHLLITTSIGSWTSGSVRCR